jgi:hypothetical protein
MFLWLRNIIRLQIKLNLALHASPFDFLNHQPNPSSIFLTLLSDHRNNKRARREYYYHTISTIITFFYIGVTVWNQIHFNFSSIEQFMLSSTFTVVILGFGIYKLILFQRPKEILKLLNALLLFEITNFGKIFSLNKLKIM